MANSVDPDQTAPIGAVCSGSTLFASILNLSVMLGNYLQQTTSAADAFFLGSLRVKDIYGKSYEFNHLIVMKLYHWQYDHVLFFHFYRCLCSLARQIGFSEKAVEIFKLEKTLGLYRQVVRLFLVFQL